MAEGDARLTTHVLDTSTGKPAKGIPVALFRLAGDAREPVAEAVTNADGRCDAPLMAGETFRIGTYELVFSAGAYLDATAGALPEPKFLSDIVIRFGMAEARHYHVPLLLSPYGFSTYRGS
ncbi:hydroxyisourate hydrolase [Aurantimonas sp. Leaf443]|uniref:hydroxyisourate hydrolase n=1 Tax=Aurantimonas sp. Leaf443 TaxID=1736378 RepID=UPI0006FFFBAA|nr:hydroxyisourate hydrolase [Aurantimonas sp. Leaf443]KQT85192.1 5-hydroxyisourate hydrolase [Aurantimonas sp. Leaf443]